MKKLMLLLVVIFVTGCSEQEKTYTVEMIDGERHVHNISPLWENDPKIELQFVQQIGDLEETDLNLILHDPDDIAVDSKGNIYICDRGNHRIQKYDTNGNYIRTIGRRGKGPNELEYPYYVQVSGQDELFISTRNGRVIKVFDLDGKYLRTLSGLKESSLMLDNDMFLRMFVYDLRDQKEIIEDYLKNTEKYPFFNLYDQSGNLTGSFGKGLDLGPPEPPRWKISYRVAADKNNNYYMVWEAVNKLEKFGSDGKLVYRADRVKNFGESTEVRTIQSNNSLGDPAIASMYNRFVNNICVDGKQRLWVEAYERQFTEEERLTSFRTLEAPDFIAYEVYDEQGVLLQRIPWEYGKARRLKYIKDDRVFFVSWPYESVYEYRIVEK
ncbi:NHL repeat-containing protein [candidate division KSB1 bacterium]